jgi:hypothetical protein
VQRLINPGNKEAHLAFVPIGLVRTQFPNGMTAAKFAVTPARLTAFIRK